MIITGAAFLLFWLLMQLTSATVLTSALVTALIFIVVGFLTGDEHPFTRRP